MNRAISWYDRHASVETMELKVAGQRGRTIKPSALAFNSKDDLFIGDELHSRILTLDMACGSCDASAFTGNGKGQRDGWKGQARFGDIRAMLFAADDSLYVTDYYTHDYADTIRVIRGNRVQTYVGRLRRAARDGDYKSVGTAEGVRLHEAESLEMLSDGSLLVAVKGQGRVVIVSPDRIVTDFVGDDPGQYYEGIVPLWGPSDAKLHPKLGVVFCESCNILRFCSLEDRQVRLLTGQLSGGHRDGSLREALFRYPTSLTVNQSGHIFVADKDNNAIRVIVPGEGVFTVAGTGVWGKRDGPVNESEFAWPCKILMMSDSSLLVTERGSDVIRCIRFQVR
ncbi:MAG: hypothetical protein HY318_12765 [Armatimonadetes bacterium]|nr:hypothetical protein [Armatimonadota bacterium]